MPIIFFDIGDTLATPRFSADGGLIGFTVFPEALAALEALRARALRMGVISNRGGVPAADVTRALEASGLLGFFDPRLLIFAKKDSPAPFVRAAAKARVSAAECIFVGENAAERGHALGAGFSDAVPHPSLVLDVLDGDALVFASLSRPDEVRGAADAAAWAAAFDRFALVPLRVSDGVRRTVYAITTKRSAESLRSQGFEVAVLGKDDDPQASDLYLLRDDRPTPAGFDSAEAFSTDFLDAAGRRDFVIGSADDGILVALPAGVSVEEFHFPDALHGHNERLIPDTSLLAPFTKAGGLLETADGAGFAPALGAQELEALRGITAESLRQLHERYIGVAPLGPSAGSIASRHISHADNARATDALLRHLAEVGGPEVVVRRHPFKYQGLSLSNVEAEFAGGSPDSFVLVTAHLDSTASSSARGFNPATDPAPGSDDDASGIAAVLAAAHAVAALRPFKRTKRTLRFVLFNAEEQGLVGSKSYARAQAAQGADIVAVFQMDMIGFRGQQSPPSRAFEVHAGFAAAPNVEAHSLALGRLVGDAVAQVSPGLSAPQVYPDTPGGPDPAAGRSDHSPFQERGYAACVLCEDFFAGPKPDSPDARPNPNYHRDTDKGIDYEYAAEIARAVAAAALLAADG
ncbi:MAG TPA: M20/M25/M40 family metallo-hydrolase [Pyrinomonadaceae bacterium]